MPHLDTRPFPRRALALPGLVRSHYRTLRRSNARYTSLRLAWSLARTVLVPGPRLRQVVGEGDEVSEGVRAKRHRVTMDAYQAGLDTRFLMQCKQAGCSGIDQAAVAKALEKVNQYLVGYDLGAKDGDRTVKIKVVPEPGSLLYLEDHQDALVWALGEVDPATENERLSQNVREALEELTEYLKERLE